MVYLDGETLRPSLPVRQEEALGMQSVPVNPGLWPKVNLQCSMLAAFPFHEKLFYKALNATEIHRITNTHMPVTHTFCYVVFTLLF